MEINLADLELFGYTIKKKDQLDQAKNNLPSFTPKIEDDGALSIAAGGVYGTYVDIEGSAKDEAELINKYRDMAQYPEIDLAVDDIVNECVVVDDNDKVVEINLDDVPITPKAKRTITAEFNNIIRLLEFDHHGYDIFRKWYVDGRLNYHAIVDVNNPKNGIIELRYIDPRKIRKVKEYKNTMNPNTRISVPVLVDEYYAYNDGGFATKKNNIGSTTSGLANVGGTLKIAKDSIVMCSSGLVSNDDKMILGYLQKAIRPLNQLRSLEDSLVIYRISRAPERRVFYIDVGGLPTAKAEQHLRDTMTRFKNKLVYDAQTGEVRDDRKFMTMLEDFWLPRREGGRGTEVTTLPGGQNLSQIDDVLYFQKQLYKSLNVPVTRLDMENVYNIGRSTEINRDEIKYAKFIRRLRSKFGTLFLKALEKQLLLKGLVLPEEWDEWSHLIKIKFNTDNYYEELKESEILKDRLSILGEMDQFVGKYYSRWWIAKNILKQSDEEIEEIANENAQDQLLMAQIAQQEGAGQEQEESEENNK